MDKNLLYRSIPKVDVLLENEAIIAGIEYYGRDIVMEAIRIGKEQGKGAVSLRGKMIDAPIVARAQQTIDAAIALGLGREV